MNARGGKGSIRSMRNGHIQEHSYCRKELQPIEEMTDDDSSATQDASETGSGGLPPDVDSGGHGRVDALC